MKKIFMMEDLECANCAKKMEDAISKIEGVSYASVSFISQRLTLEYDETREAKIFKEAAKACRKFEPDCRIIFK